MVDRQVPGAAQDNPERIQSRDAGDFARLPREELQTGGVPTRDAGVAGRVVWPPVLITIGFLIAFSVFILRFWPLLVIGFVLILIGTVWSIAGHRGGRGLGPTTVRESR